MTKVKIETEKCEGLKALREVKTIWDDAVATQMLQEGWTLMHAGCAHKDAMGYNAKAVFVLAR